ncbi:hypothetical protein T492DRAFT_871717, partial [Pavlovales sp. CCMP2436]
AELQAAPHQHHLLATASPAAAELQASLPIVDNSTGFPPLLGEGIQLEKDTIGAAFYSALTAATSRQEHQHDLASLPGNPHLYSCDFCTRRNMLACEAECHLQIFREKSLDPPSAGLAGTASSFVPTATDAHRPLLAKAAAPNCKGAGVRSSPSAWISGRRLNNWKKKHCADGTLRPGAEMRVAVRTDKLRAGLPARQEATVAPRSSPAAAGKPRANASSRASAKPAQTRTLSESDSDEDSELLSGTDEDSAMEEDIDESLSDATEAMAARCFGRYAAPRRAYDGPESPRCPSGAPLPGGDYVLNNLFTTGGQCQMPLWSENFRTVVFDDDYTLFTPKDLRRVLRVITKDLQIWESADADT